VRVVRRWSVRHARFLEVLLGIFNTLLRRFHPLLRRLGYGRLEAPVAAVERRLKGAMFDCRMCGKCILRFTGMACPMNCPKSLRNGPCGGVRPDGGCEVEPAMRCVWVEAWEGSQRMRDNAAIIGVQPPLDARMEGSSAWLRFARQIGEELEEKG
jgi:hypothetical protein